MTIAELFVNLGVKGSEKTQQAISGVRKGLKEVSTTSLETKAAIIGIVYGLERLMSGSARTGTDLANFNSLTGLSTKQLQEWQFAARQAGVSSEEFTGSLKGVQQTMTNMLLGKSHPEGLAMVANKVGFDKNRARDSFYVMEQLQKFAKEVPPDVGNQMIRSFGVSDGVIAAMRRNSFNPEMFKKAPIYSTGEIGQLNKVDVAWSNLGNKIQMAFGHFTAKHGMQLVSDLSKVTSQVIKMTEAFMKLAEKLKVFELIGKVFEGWGMIFQGLNDVASGKIKKDDFMEGTKDFFKGTWMSIKDDFSGAGIGSTYRDKEFEERFYKEHVAPRLNQSGGGSNQKVEINQNLNFHHDGKDAKKTGSSVNKAVRDAYRQMQAQAQGS